MLSQLKLLGIYQRELSKNHGCAGAALEAVAEAAVKDAVGGDEPFCYVNVNNQGDVTRTVKRADSWCKKPLYERPQASAADGKQSFCVPEAWYNLVSRIANQPEVGEKFNPPSVVWHWIQEAKLLLDDSQPEVK